MEIYVPENNLETFPTDQMPFKEIIEKVEKDIITAALLKTDGNQKQAAEVLRIKYTTLNEKIKRYNIEFQKIVKRENQ